MKQLVSLVTLLAFLLGSVTALSSDELLADKVVVNKSERMLYLVRDDAVIKSYDIKLGLAPRGHKQEEGDFRTPEGDYLLTRRVIDSDFFMSIEVSYPNAEDTLRAERRGVAPGGSIMIHGQPLNPKQPERYYRNYDWTDGCIAVSNKAMTDIWQFTRPNTPVTILP